MLGLGQAVQAAEQRHGLLPLGQEVGASVCFTFLPSFHPFYFPSFLLSFLPPSLACFLVSYLATLLPCLLFLLACLLASLPPFRPSVLPSFQIYTRAFQKRSHPGGEHCMKQQQQRKPAESKGTSFSLCFQHVFSVATA
jgi:hypothetical protein